MSDEIPTTANHWAVALPLALVAALLTRWRWSAGTTAGWRRRAGAPPPRPEPAAPAA